MHCLLASDFTTQSELPVLGDAEIHLWLLETPTTLHVRALSSLTHAALGQLLTGYAATTQAPPLIVRGQYGKPSAPALPDIEFNMSHSGRCALIAIARSQAVGVDVERSDRKWSIDGIARRYFSDNENRALVALSVVERADAFLRLWTAKEAVLKAIGRGISFGLDRVEIALDAAGGGARLDRISAGGTDDGDPDITRVAGSETWWLRALQPAPGYFGALAWCGPDRVVRAFKRSAFPLPSSS